MAKKKKFWRNKQLEKDLKEIRKLAPLIHKLYEKYVLKKPK